MLRNIYYRKIDVKNAIEPNLFTSTWKTLNEAIEKGIGKIAYNSPDADFAYELRHNAGMFSAFKVHRQQNDMASQLLDENGELKSFSQWVKDVEPIVTHNNKNWLQTEYSTAIMRAREASNFRKYQRDADLFPNLKWLPSTSIDKRESHVVFYGLVKPINDPFWQQHYPGNIWNCKCGITNTDVPPTKQVLTPDYSPAPGLDKNPAGGELFTRSHPYYTNAYPGAKEAAEKAVAQTKNEIELRILKTFNNGGSVSVYQYMIDPKQKDYTQLRRICEWFAENTGAKTVILPKPHPKSAAYREIFGILSGTKYESKSPDLLIDDKFYEFESHKSDKPKQALRNMLNRGLKQSDRVIIDFIEIGKHYLLRNIYGRINTGQNITEIWMKKNNELLLLYKKQKPKIK